MDNIGQSVLDFIDVTIDRATGNIQSGTDETSAKVKILDATADRIRTDAENRRERERLFQKIAVGLSTVLALTILIIVVSKFVVPAFKK